jgi:hypothetical protein
MDEARTRVAAEREQRPAPPSVTPLFAGVSLVVAVLGAPARVVGLRVCG